MNIFELKDKDIKIIPDIIHEYKPSIKESAVPLIIDNGSYQCRVGWSCNTEPMLIFRNLIAKPRKDRSKKDGDTPVTPPIQIGNDIINIEAMRFQLKTQFDRNVVTHYQNQEQIFDYIFKHLAIDSDGGVPHPIILTECFINPNYCRQLMSEVLFECYDIPSVSYGVDALYSFHYNKIGENGLIISCGFHTTHIIPILRGKVQSQKSRRINIGGFHMINYLYRLLQLKYPVHSTSITISRMEWLLHNHCSIAYDYMDELNKWSGFEFYEQNVKKIQLSYNLSVSGTLTAEQKFERKREMAKRLADINAKKREEKLIEDEDQLQKLLTIRDLYDDGNDEEYQDALKDNQILNYDELEKLIQNITSKIDRAKQKIAATTETQNGQHQLYPFEEKYTIPKPPSNMSIDEWVKQVRAQRTTLLERKNTRRQRKHDLAKRRTVAAQERMRIISQLARKESRKEKSSDDFGIRDEDWDVYKTISRENGDSDSEGENEKLIEMEEILRHHDSTFEDPNLIHNHNNSTSNGAGGGLNAESYQLHVGVEAIRSPEILFQPSIIGSSEAGLVETIDFVLKLFTKEEQLLLVNSIFLCGGCAKFPGLHERLSREMMAIRPFQTPYKIQLAKDLSLDTWHGMREFVNSESSDEQRHNFLITKNDYTELGGEYLKEHYASNPYFQTPAPIILHDPIPSSSSSSSSSVPVITSNTLID